VSRRPVSYMFQCIECLGSAATRRRVARCAPHGLASTYCLSSRSSRSFQCGVAVMPALRVGVRRCRAIVASSDSGCGSACITNACFMRSRCTSMPQKRIMRHATPVCQTVFACGVLLTESVINRVRGSRPRVRIMTRRTRQNMHGCAVILHRTNAHPEVRDRGRRSVTHRTHSAVCVSVH
jgi:hypothetical protein